MLHLVYCPTHSLVGFASFLESCFRPPSTLGLWGSSLHVQIYTKSLSGIEVFACQLVNYTTLHTKKNQMLITGRLEPSMSAYLLA